jgi:hypothetical protein
MEPKGESIAELPAPYLIVTCRCASIVKFEVAGCIHSIHLVNYFSHEIHICKELSTPWMLAFYETPNKAIHIPKKLFTPTVLAWPGDI